MCNQDTAIKQPVVSSYYISYGRSFSQYRGTPFITVVTVPVLIELVDGPQCA